MKKYDDARLRLTTPELAILRGALNSYARTLKDLAFDSQFQSVSEKIEKAVKHARHRNRQQNRLHQMEGDLSGYHNEGEDRYNR